MSSTADDCMKKSNLLLKSNLKSSQLVVIQWLYIFDKIVFPNATNRFYDSLRRLGGERGVVITNLPLCYILTFFLLPIILRKH